MANNRRRKALICFIIDVIKNTKRELMKFNLKFFDLILGKHPYQIALRFHHSEKWYQDDYLEFKRLLGENSDFPIKDDNPCLDDKYDNAGTWDGHYFYQDLYVAQKVYENNPVKHVDIGSRIDGFVTHVASFRKIELLDIRKMTSNIPNVTFKQIDLMDEKNIPSDYCDSISSLHALEHFGLGRYGDKLDPDGHLKGFKNITKMLKPGGAFYFSVPLGPQRIEFNAHRVFSLSYLRDWLSADYDVVSFAYIDNGVLHQNVSLTDELIKNNCGCKFGCAIFELRKR